jgi:hypothetical protein
VEKLRAFADGVNECRRKLDALCARFEREFGDPDRSSTLMIPVESSCLSSVGYAQGILEIRSRRHSDSAAAMPGKAGSGETAQN